MCYYCLKPVRGKKASGWLDPARRGEALALSAQGEGAGQLWTNTHRPAHTQRRPCGARAEAGGTLSSWAPRPLLEKNELGKERLTRRRALLTVHSTTKSWQLPKEKGWCGCRSNLSVSSRQQPPGLPPRHTLITCVWPALSICSEPLLPRRGFLPSSTGRRASLPPRASPQRGSCFMLAVDCPHRLPARDF